MGLQTIVYRYFESGRWLKKAYYLFNLLFAKLIDKIGLNPLEHNAWLIANGEDAYGNNVKCMYEYLISQGRKPYWVCDGEHLQRIKDAGIASPIKRGSLKNYLLAINAEVGIFTHSDSDVAPRLYRWFSRKTFLADLTHGNTGNKKLDDHYISDIVLDLWCCCSAFERDLVIQGGCSPEKAVITGMARYDRIPAGHGPFDLDALKVMVMPTWREWYLNGNKNFKETGIYKEYNDILNFLEREGCRITFVLHNKFAQYYKTDLQRIWPHIKVVNGSAQIQQELLENNLLITDYSSVLWEFIYQDKPVILYWYDMEEYNERPHEKIFTGGTYPEFEKLMADNICHTLDEFQRKFTGLKQGKNLCVSDRDMFFQFSDQNNCQRIYQTIMEKLRKNEE